MAFNDLDSVPGLSETSHEFCTNRASSANCDGSSDFYLNWVFTKSYSALQIQLRATMMNSATHDSQTISLKVELCEDIAERFEVNWNLNSTYLVLKNQSYPEITAIAESNSSDCSVDSNSY